MPAVRCVRVAAGVTQLVSSGLSSQVSVNTLRHTRLVYHATHSTVLTSLVSIVLSVTAVGGYIVIVTQLHPETNDDDITDAFSDFGNITTLHLNLDRRTGYVKGYALLEYAREEEARRAVEEGDGMVVMERQVKVDWALKRGNEPVSGRERERRGGGGGESGKSGGVIRRDYRDLGKDRDRGRDRGRDSGRDRDRDRERDR